eukprot:1427998-Prymnesium_polylepis.1
MELLRPSTTSTSSHDRKMELVRAHKSTAPSQQQPPPQPQLDDLDMMERGISPASAREGKAYPRYLAQQFGAHALDSELASLLEEMEVLIRERGSNAEFGLRHAQLLQ